MKRLLLLLACLLALCTTVVAAEPAISDMKTDCTLTGSGACQVTQTFTMEIDGAQTQLRFPLVPGAKKASVAGYDAQKQTDGDCPVLVLSDASGFTGTRSFTVLYTVSGLVSEADGVQTLQLPLLSAKWAYPISRYQFTVTMPKPFEGYPAFVSGYYSDVISDYIDLDVSESLISGTIATGLKDHESLDMTLTLDKSYFSGAYTALSFSWVGMAVIVALLALAFGYWFVTLRSAPIRTSTRRLPPDAALPCDMPFLVGGGPIQFNMLVCHWASLGYLTIFCGKNGRVAPRRRVDMGNERRPAEVRLFQMLFSQGDVCEGASLCTSARRKRRTRCCGATGSAGSTASRAAIRSSRGPSVCLQAHWLRPRRQVRCCPRALSRWLLLIAAFLIGGALSAVILHAPSAYYQGKKLFVALAALAAVALLTLAQFGEGLLAVLLVIVCLVLLGLLTLHGGRRTAFGDEIVTQAMSYRRFLRRVTQSQLLSRLAQDSQYFYRILPYAEAIGLGAGLARTLGNTELEQCDWYQEQQPLPRTAAGFYSHLQEALALLELSIRK
ncbi:MAG: DUF2207 family protein [Oscillospiraceae bacterium]